MVLRLLGNEKCRQGAIEDWRRIPEDDPEYAERLDTVAELLHAVEYDKQIPESERTPFMTEARADHIRYTEQMRREGRLEEARTAVYDMCKALNVEVTAPRRSQIEKMDLDELRSLRDQLLQRRDWPLN